MMIYEKIRHILLKKFPQWPINDLDRLYIASVLDKLVMRWLFVFFEPVEILDLPPQVRLSFPILFFLMALPIGVF